MLKRIQYYSGILAILWSSWIVCFLIAETNAASKSPKTITPLSFSSELFEEKWKEMGLAVDDSIAKQQLPGGVLWLERNRQQFAGAFGKRALLPAPEAMTEDTIFDAASLTKVVATTPAIMLLIQSGQLDLEARASKYWPSFGVIGKENITVRQLLTHTSGLRPDLSLNPPWTTTTTALQLTCEEKLITPPGEAFCYSDINFIVLGELVRRISSKPLDEYVHQHIFKVLGMKDTGFNPPKKSLGRVAPTEKTASGVLRGVVHDPTARRMEGVAGHAGLFTTAEDLAIYSRMLINQGRHLERVLFTPETVRLMTEVQTPPLVTARRGLGWDIDSPFAGPRGKIFPIGSYGHSGWTGTSLWIDPYSKTFVIFLSNRNHPSEDGSVLGLRHRLGTLAAEAVQGFNFAYVPTALLPLTDSGEKTRPVVVKPTEVLNGIDVLEKENFKSLRGLKIGLITNHSGKNRKRIPTLDLLAKAEGVTLVALFSPEHGIRGQLDTTVDDSKDELTGLPVYSLYGARRIPTTQQLTNLDALVFDIQDIGCRFYTYISTLGNCLNVAQQHGLRFFVLDRVNPISGDAVEGPLLDGEESFTAFHPLVVRHGMTTGELARMFIAERNWKVDLKVIPVKGWNRSHYFDATELPWTNPSPNMRSLTQATLYPGIGLLETTSLSVGRGTDTPFEMIGAPYIDDGKFAREANLLGLPGIRFVPVQFTPSSSVFAGKRCHGINLIVLDRHRLHSVATGVALATLLQRLYPEQFEGERFNRLLVHPKTMDQIRTGIHWMEIEKSWGAEHRDFLKRRTQYLLY